MTRYVTLDKVTSLETPFPCLVLGGSLELWESQNFANCGAPPDVVYTSGICCALGPMHAVGQQMGSNLKERLRAENYMK